MIAKALATITGVIIATISAGGYPAILGLMALESACIPIPSEVIMPFSGYLASTGRFDLLLVATGGALGCNLGSTVAYVVGRRGGRPLVEKWGHYILVNRHDLDLADRFFARWGGIAVLLARLLPVVRTFIALPAGIAHMRQLPFQIYTFVGSWPWCYALAYIGFRLGRRWEADPRLRNVLHRLDVLVVVVIVLAVGWYLWRHLRRRDG